MNRTFSALLLSLALGVQPACAGGRRPPPTPDLVEDALAYTTTDRAKSVKLLEQALERNEVSERELPWVQLHAGEQRRLSGDFPKAREWFDAALASGDKRALPSARLGLALLAAKPPYDELPAALEDIPEREVLETLNASRYLLIATHKARAGGSPTEVKEATKKAVQYSRDDAELAKRVNASLDILTASVGTPNTSITLPPPVGEPTKSPIEQARAFWESGDNAGARTLAAEIKAAGGPDARAAGYLIQRIDKGTPIDSKKIGVLLPLTGKYKAAGRQVLEALQLGYGTAGRTLVPIDSGSTPETAVAALEKMVLDDGMIAVVGPLLTPETEAVVEAANALGVPLISLSQALEDTDDMSWVFQAMVTPGHQAEALASFVMEQKDMKAFAIFAPDNAYGKGAAAEFRATVEERGGTISIEEFYDPTSTDLIPFAKKLGRKDYEARSWEFRELKREAAANGGNPDSVVLPPKIDFDGLFVPDSAARVPLACAALAYEEFPVGDFQTSRNGRTVPMLGLNGWNHPDIVSRGGPYVRGAFFTDAFAEHDADAVAFATEFREAKGHSPSVLEAVSVDAGRLLAAAAKSDATTPSAFREALLAVEVKNAGTGAAGFNAETRTVSRDMRILTVGEGTIQQVWPKPAPSDDPATPQ